MSKLNAAPKANAGQSIDLAAMQGKAVAVRITQRAEVATRFGDKTMSAGQILVEGESEPMEGVFFQSYFQRLALNEWFAGVVVKSDRAWGLDAEAVKQPALKKLQAAIEKVPDNALPF